MDSNYWGVISVDSIETDYQLSCGGDGSQLLPVPRHTFDQLKIQYNQPDIAPMSCTLHGALGCLSDLSGFTFTQDQRKGLWSEALKLGASDSKGWYIRKAVDLVRQEGAKILGEGLKTFLVSFGSESFYHALDMGYSVNCGFRGNKSYNSDRIDGILDGIYFGDTTYGHAVRCVRDVEDGVYNLIVDNYSKSTNKPNIYKIKKENIDNLLKNKVFFSEGYIFVFSSDWDEMLNISKIPVWAAAAADAAKKKGIKIEWSNPEEIVGDSKMEEWFISLGALTQKLGNISLARFMVALYRLGIFNL